MEQNVQRVTVKEEDIKEEPHDYVIGSQTDDEKPALELHCNVKTEPHTAEDGTSYNAELVAKTERDTETDGSSDETEITAVEIEVQLEDDEEEQDNRLDLGVSEPLHRTQQEFHGQNDELDLQLTTDQIELETHQQEEERRDLNVHVLIHTGETPHKSFTDQTQLESHQAEPLLAIVAAVPESSHRTQQQFHGQNDELDLQEPTGGQQHHCTVCWKSFTDQIQLETHQQEDDRTLHPNQDSGKRFYNITQCGEHKVIYVGGKMYKYFECPICGQLLAHKSVLKMHMFKHTGEMPYKCDHCGKSFTTRKSLKTHMSIHTIESHQQAEPLLVIVAAVPEPSHRTQQQFHGQNDELDLQQTTDQTELETHQQEHNHTLGVQHQSLQEMGRTRLKSKKCPQCGKSFKDLQGHLRTHVEKKKPPPYVESKPYQCEKCDKVFAQKTHLKTHWRLMHSGVKPYQCEKCGKVFAQWWGLKTHWRLIHSGRKPHVCVVCGEAFAISLQHWKHMFTHQSVSEHPQRTQQKFHGQNEELDIQEPTGSLQHHCTVCRKSFTHQTQLETHQQEEHNHTLEVHQYQDSDKRSFNITQCGEYKVIHVGEKAYTYVECPVCGQLLINKSALKKHMFKHSGEMPYKCDHCGEGFTKRGSLNAHILIHTGETPHKSFTDQTQLESHQQAEPLLAIVAAVPESSHRTQQQFHGQNDTELDLQEPTASLQHHCTVCRKSFTDQTQLDTHQQEKHHHTLGVQHQSDTETLGVQHQLLQEMGRTRLKSQRCPQCGKPFRDLQGHLLTHVEKKKPPPCVQLKPYQCEKCGKVFAQKTGLQTHWRLIHSGVKPHVCVVCGEAFAIALQRWKHMFTHQNKR